MYVESSWDGFHNERQNAKWALFVKVLVILHSFSFGSGKGLVGTVKFYSTIDSSTVNSMNLIPTQRPAGES